MTTRYLPLVMLIALSGCSFVGAENPEWTQQLQTRGASFSFEGSTVVIAASYRNDSDYDVRLNPCGYGELLLLQKLVRGSFRTVYRPVCQAVGRTPTVVTPGNSLSLVFEASDDPKSHPEFSAERQGVYRLVAPNTRDDRGRPGALQSNTFLIDD